MCQKRRKKLNSLTNDYELTVKRLINNNNGHWDKV